MKLAEWSEQNPELATVLRRRIGKKTYAKYRNGSVSRADPETIRVIAEVTRYAVTANDFYDISPPDGTASTMQAAGG